jgi:hypothetical protein
MHHNTKLGKICADGVVTRAIMLLQLTGKIDLRPSQRSEDVPREDLDYIANDDNVFDNQIADHSSDHDEMNLRETRAHFNCTAGEAKWSTGWSVAKKQFCCKTTGIGCLTNRTAKRSDGSSSMDGKTKVNSSTAGDLGNEPNANTSDDRPNGNTLNNTAGDPSDMMGNTTVNATNSTGCITDTPQSEGLLFAVTSAAGTPCVFGTDKRDEGWHCIMDAGKYGSLGWCWTSKSHSSWGPCSENCPLFGQAGVLGKKIDALGEDLRRFGKQVLNTSMVAPGSSLAKKGSDHVNGHKPTKKHVAAKSHANRL